MSMASIRPVNWDDIGARFGAPPFSSGQGSHVCHSTPQAQIQKKTKKALGPAKASIQEGFASNRISSGSDSRASRVEPEVPESAPAESTPGTSGKSHSMFAVMKKITKFFKL
ncbi:hypothetical protein ACE6H2_006037 [Prunus campanulata]